MVIHEWWRISFAQLSGTWREGYSIGDNELWGGDMWMDLLRWDENGRWFVFHINDHQWHPLLCIVKQIDLWSTLWVLVFLHPFQFMPTGLMNKVDIMSGTQHFPPLKFLSDYLHSVQFSSVQSLSCVWLFATPWIAARQASLSITNSWSPPKPMSIVGDAI